MAAQLALEGRKSSAPAAPLPTEDAASAEEAPVAEREEAVILEESAEEIERGRRAVGGV